MQKILALLILLSNAIIFTKSAAIIIHGTWAQSEVWHTAQGDFFKAVKRSAEETKVVDEIISFSWSGKLSYACQLEAAQKLKTLIESYGFVILIGHSHGATVGIIASQLMNQNKSNFEKIKKFYALGVPVDSTMKIYPDMNVIKNFYNLFSFGDYVQTVNGAHLRCFAPHERLANISVMIHDNHLAHGQLHHATIGKELLKIEHYFAFYDLGNFNNFDWHQPGMIQFFDYELPKYCVQHDQQRLLDLDQKVQWMMQAALFRKLYKKDEVE